MVVDGRARAGGGTGTGVSSYARALAAAVERAGWPPATLAVDRGGYGGLARAERWARVAASRPRRLGVAADGDLLGHDLFRIAKLHFGLWGRPLVLRVPGPPGIMHWTYPTPMRVAGWANLYTVHDVIPLTHPSLTDIDGPRHRRMLAAIARHAARFVTVTGAARDTIVGATGLDPGFVVDCGQAALLPEPEPDTPAGLRRDRFFLYCGLIEPRKNLERLIEAHRRAATGLPLVIVGPEGWRSAPILRRAEAADGVIRLPYQSRPALAALLRDARALLFPSLAEGFGLPVAEAMTLGTPTLISRDPALAEVAGGAALVVDGEDIAAIANGIARLARDDALRSELGARGIVRARAFALDRFAARIGALYASIG